MAPLVPCRRQDYDSELSQRPASRRGCANLSRLATSAITALQPGDGHARTVFAVAARRVAGCGRDWDRATDAAAVLDPRVRALRLDVSTVVAENFGQSARLSINGRARPRRDRPRIRALADLGASLRPAETVPFSPLQLLLGAAFAILPEPGQRPHGLTADAVMSSVHRRPGRDMPVTVAFWQGAEF